MLAVLESRPADHGMDIRARRMSYRIVLVFVQQVHEASQPRRVYSAAVSASLHRRAV